MPSDYVRAMPEYTPLSTHSKEQSANTDRVKHLGSQDVNQSLYGIDYCLTLLIQVCLVHIYTAQINTDILRSVFKAPLMNLRQLENKMFKNSTGFLSLVKYFFFKFSFVVFPQLPESAFIFFSNLKTDRDTRTSILIFFKF